MLTELMQTEGANGGGSRGGVVINGIRRDPATATHVYTSVADDCFIGDGFCRFDEELYRNPDSYWFLVRPLAPDKEQEWLEDGRHDSIFARQLFPGDAGDD